jgi:molybdenum cofactor biosynthesis protein B
MGHTEHKHLTPKVSVGAAVLTISDSRTEETDESGRLAKELLTEAGHTIEDYRIIPNDAGEIKSLLGELLQREDLRLIITSGGTGIGRKDLTVESASGLVGKEIEGFGELFRHLSYLEIGPASMVSRALGGVCGNKVLFCLPGSRNAMELAVTKLILPQLDHMIWELDRS